MDAREKAPQSQSNEQSSVPSGTKKRYTRPELTDYGPVVDQTNTVGKTSNHDGGTWPTNRTQP